MLEWEGRVLRRRRGNDGMWGRGGGCWAVMVECCDGGML